MKAHSKAFVCISHVVIVTFQVRQLNNLLNWVFVTFCLKAHYYWDFIPQEPVGGFIFLFLLFHVLTGITGDANINLTSITQTTC